MKDVSGVTCEDQPEQAVIAVLKPVRVHMKATSITRKEEIVLNDKMACPLERHNSDFTCS